MRARGDRGVDVRGEQGDDFASSNASLREEDNLLVAGRVRGAALRAHGEAHLARVPGTLHGEGRELWGGCRLGCRLERFALFLEATRDGAIDAPREASNLGPSADAVLVPARLETVELLHHLARDGDEDADARRGTESLEEFAKRRAAATDERVGVGHEGEDGTVGAVARGEERGRRGEHPGGHHPALVRRREGEGHLVGVEEVVAARGRRATERGDGRKRAPDQILVHVHGSGVENVVVVVVRPRVPTTVVDSLHVDVHRVTHHDLREGLRCARQDLRTAASAFLVGGGHPSDFPRPLPLSWCRPRKSVWARGLAESGDFYGSQTLNSPEIFF